MQMTLPGRSALDLGSAGLLALWLAFWAFFFVAPDKHEWRIAFSWCVLLPLLLSIKPVLAYCRTLGWPAALTGIWLLYLGISAFWGPDGHQFAFRTIKYALYIFLFVIFTAYMTHRFARWLPYWLDSLVLAGSLAMAAMMVHQLMLPRGLVLRMEGFGLLRNPLEAAIVSGILMVVALGRLVESSGRRRYFYMAATFVFLSAMLLTKSRWPLLMSFAVLPAMHLFDHQRGHRVAVTLTACIGVVIAGLVFSGSLDEVFSRGIDFSFRDVIWESVWRDIVRHPLFGIGLYRDEAVVTSAGTFSHAHNVFLSIQRFSGLPGTMLFVGLIATLLVKAYRAGDGTSWCIASWLIYALLCLVTNGFFPIGKPDYDWFMLWLPWGTLLALNRRSHGGITSGNPAPA